MFPLLGEASRGIYTNENGGVTSQIWKAPNSKNAVGLTFCDGSCGIALRAAVRGAVGCQRLEAVLQLELLNNAADVCGTCRSRLRLLSLLSVCRHSRGPQLTLDVLARNRPAVDFVIREGETDTHALGTGP